LGGKGIWDRRWWVVVVGVLVKWQGMGGDKGLDHTALVFCSCREGSWE